MKQVGKKSFYLNLVCIIGMIGIFVIGSIVLIHIGEQAYKNTVRDTMENNKLRTALSYITAKVCETDEEGCIYIEKKKGVDVLVINPKSYNRNSKTFIYFYKGKLYEVNQEKFQLAEKPFGYEIMKLKEFTMAEVANNLIRFTATDYSGHEESITINIKSRR